MLSEFKAARHYCGSLLWLKIYVASSKCFSNKDFSMLLVGFFQGRCLISEVIASMKGAV